MPSSSVFYRFFPRGRAILVIFLQLYFVVHCSDVEDPVTGKSEDLSKVEVRAVFLNCDSDGDPDSDGSPRRRFEREELYKHDSLRDCDKKLALTVKLDTDPREQQQEDSYIPIEHVALAGGRRRARLLNPYVLRVRRRPVAEAYLLRRTQTVTATFLDEEAENSEDLPKLDRVRREVEVLDRGSPNDGDDAGDTTDAPGNDSEGHIGVTVDVSRHIFNSQSVSYKFSVPSGGMLQSNVKISDNIENKSTSKNTLSLSNLSMLTTAEANISSTLNKRRYLTEDYTDYRTTTPLISRDRYYPHADAGRWSLSTQRSYNNEEFAFNGDEEGTYNMKDGLIRNGRSLEVEKTTSEKIHVVDKEFEMNISAGFDKDDVMDYAVKIGDSPDQKKEQPREYVVYEVGDPTLWYSADIQLFEKLNTPEGKVVWNDLTKGDVASVSSHQPQWSGVETSVSYQPAQCVSRDQFSLGDSPLYLLLPTTPADKETEYIIVPRDDVIDPVAKTSQQNATDSSDATESSPSPLLSDVRPVVVRLKRATRGSLGEARRVETRGADTFLSVPHGRAFRAQLDLEARADDNQLVDVGASASLPMVVADSSRRSQTALTVQATNTGLAAARFKAVVRDCAPALAAALAAAGDAAGGARGELLLAPRHSRRLRLHLPFEVPADVTHCSVALLNAEDETVAVREVAIKNGDRCFCVWHCDCVCLSEDPKLQCRAMSPARQAAAGVGGRRRRAVCPTGCPLVDAAFVAVFVLLVLGICGFCKAVVGLVIPSVEMMGLKLMVKLPRHMEQYYEASLKGRAMVYDAEGWPIHPDTKKRVRTLSRFSAFILNVTFFIIMPLILLRNLCALLCSNGIVTSLTSKIHELKTKIKRTGRSTDKNVSFTDVQSGGHGRRRARPALRPWMTPTAEHLSTDLWHNELNPLVPVRGKLMHPLLCERERAGSDGDSEHDDTHYVLMQMQKSRHSLAKCQRRGIVSDGASSRQEWTRNTTADSGSKRRPRN